MYLGIDVGGTKTLVATLDDNGVITDKQKFPTPQIYEDFLAELKTILSQKNNEDYRAVGIGIPVTNFYREEGIARTFSNLNWRDVHIQHDVEQLTKTPVAVENDAKLAGLSESRLRPDIERLLYVTLSTGIGYSLINNGKIDPNIGDAGGRLLMLEYKGKLTPWEEFASGRAIVNIYGKMAKDITDEKTWDSIARKISLGLIELIAVAEPDLIVIGGSVGTYFDRYAEPINKYMQAYETPLLKMPPVEAAKRPEEAVIYGCYDYAIQVFGVLNAA